MIAVLGAVAISAYAVFGWYVLGVVLPKLPRQVTQGPRLSDDPRYAAMRAGQEVNDASDATEEWTADHPRVGDAARRVPVGARPTV